MFIPVGTVVQYIEQVDKDVVGKVTTQEVMGVRVRKFDNPLSYTKFNDAAVIFCSMFH